MQKQIEQLTEDDLIELWGVIGGTPHLFEYGKDELKRVLITGECVDENDEPCGLSLGYYTMAAIVDKLRERGFAAPMDWPEPLKEKDNNPLGGLPIDK